MASLAQVPVEDSMRADVEDGEDMRSWKRTATVLKKSRSALASVSYRL
jgi:hypothetical protein